jgi:hypothetical protein
MIDHEDLELVHANGVPWWEAKVPHRWHRCRVQTSGVHRFVQVERCACGAIRLDGRVWLERNSRKPGVR